MRRNTEAAEHVQDGTPELLECTRAYECSSRTDEVRAGEVDLNRIYDRFYYLKEYRRKQRHNHRGHKTLPI